MTRNPSPLRTFITAVLYGVALLAAISNTLALVLGVLGGQPNPSNLSLGLLGWALVLYTHYQRGWPPFGSRGRR